MAKVASKIRGKFADEKYTGPEPTLTATSTLVDEAKFYGWFNYYYSDEDAKGFAIAYLKSIKFDTKKIKKLNSCDAADLRIVGWLGRGLLQGSILPVETEKMFWRRIDALLNRTAEPLDAAPVPVDTEIGAETKVVSIQERIHTKAGNLIADIEDLLDIFYREGKTFDAAKWFRDKDVKPPVAQKIAEYYKPLYAEIFDAMQAKDEQLVEGYRHWKKTKLKAYLEFIKSIVGAAEQRIVVVKAIRKPRKKKEKPVTSIVAKLQYLEHDKELDIKSVKATEIVGAQQLWVYNIKYRTLAVYNAIGPSGISVKGTTLLGFDEKTSIVKKLRKPKEQLHALSNAGKVVLRKFMDGIKCKPKEASGRINKETILIRVGK